MGDRDDSQRELRRMRGDAAAREAEIGRLRDQVRGGEAEIAGLRAEAIVREAILASAQEELAAAELELDDLRAVRDALTPPSLPVRPGLTLDVTFAPATQRVSGDFYLAAEGPDRSTALVVGDVTGKGFEAARRAVFVRSTFAAAAPYSDDPRDLLAWANAALLASDAFEERFATAACVTYAPASGRLRLALAGHPPPLRLRSGEPLGARPAPPLGLTDAFSCTAAETTLAPGDGILLYTDGLTEARGRSREQFGPERAAAALRTLRDRPGPELLDRLRAEVVTFSDETLADDLCLLTAVADQAPSAA